MKAYVFPGQGAQFIGMGKDLYDSSAEAKELLSETMRPPMNKVKFGLKNNEIEIGGECFYTLSFWQKYWEVTSNQTWLQDIL